MALWKQLYFLADIWSGHPKQCLLSIRNRLFKFWNIPHSVGEHTRESLRLYEHIVIPAREYCYIVSSQPQWTLLPGWARPPSWKPHEVHATYLYVHGMLYTCMDGGAIWHKFRYNKPYCGMTNLLCNKRFVFSRYRWVQPREPALQHIYAVMNGFVLYMCLLLQSLCIEVIVTMKGKPTRSKWEASNLPYVPQSQCDDRTHGAYNPCLSTGSNILCTVWPVNVQTWMFSGTDLRRDAEYY